MKVRLAVRRDKRSEIKRMLQTGLARAVALRSICVSSYC
jgi:hypothetical protein